MKMLMAALAACAVAAVPAASGQYMKFDGVKGETQDNRISCPTDGEAIQGSLDRDIIRRIPRRPAALKPIEKSSPILANNNGGTAPAGDEKHKNEIEILSATDTPPVARTGGVNVAVGDVNGDGRADTAAPAPGRTRYPNITLKRGAAADDPCAGHRPSGQVRTNQ